MNKQATILERIIYHKRTEVESQKVLNAAHSIETCLEHAPPIRDFAAALRTAKNTALIAEVKKASPSRGVLIEQFNHVHLAHTYGTHGAAALSVLTDVAFFQGAITYLSDIRRAQTHTDKAQQDESVSPPELPISPLPLLRKDFIIDPYQVYEARIYGADAILLIVAALDNALLKELHDLAVAIGMHVLVEVHDKEELARALAMGARIIGVNNRDLHTFKTSLTLTETLATLLPSGDARPLLVSESGIRTAADVVRLRGCGVDAILVGESLVTAPDIAAKVQELAMA